MYVRAMRYTAGQAEKITGLGYRAIDYLAKKGLVSPSTPAAGKGTRREFSFRDLVALRTIRDLREAGISLQAIRRVAEAVQGMRGLSSSSDALASAVLVVDPTGKRDVYMRDGETYVSALRQPGQAVLCVVIPVGEIAREVREAARKFAA